MRRYLSRLSVFAVAVVCPVVASAANEIADPDGLTAAAPGAVDWLDSVVRFLVVYVGI
jgi:hypothetical protein